MLSFSFFAVCFQFIFAPDAFFPLLHYTWLSSLMWPRPTVYPATRKKQEKLKETKRYKREREIIMKWNKIQ